MSRSFAVITLVLSLAVPLAAQTPSSWNDRLAIAEGYRIPGLDERRFTHREFWDAVAPSLRSDRLQVEEVGRSIQGREIRTVTFGHGAVRVLLWSQMHGDEATATMALADIFAFLAAPGENPVRDRIGEKLTVVFIPMLNPDGAELFQRQNAIGIDVNRDARRLVTPEAQTLKAVRDRIQPDFGFNLHDQSARTRVGRGGGQAAIALLAPASDMQRSWGPVRVRARLLAAYLARDFANGVPGAIAKYDDSHEPRAFGDLMQQWGVSTVLIESGAIAGDPQKQRLRTLNAVSILGALDAIATGAYRNEDPEQYERLPFNAGGAADLLVRGGSIVLPGSPPIRADITINFDDSVARTGGRISDIGDLQSAIALDTVDATGRFLHASPGSLTARDGATWLRLGSPANFTIREAAEPGSPEIRKVP
ncbi:MAG TPA: M14 family zinc carboxypeptidase [Gemmatimonadales bacterium]|nr:M14 family zinc carboxypeptidase [Gemmatimonadales bacterium]